MVLFWCRKKHPTSFENSMIEDLCMVDYFSGKGEAHQAFSQKLNFINIDGGCFCSWFDLTNLIDNIIQKYIIIYPTARGHSHYSFHPKCCLGSANVKASGSQIRIASSRCCQNLAGHVWENLQYIYYETIYIIDRYSLAFFHINLNNIARS